MADSLDRSRLNHAFTALGKRVHQPTRVMIGGAGALILCGELNRATTDCDVLLSHPDMGQLQGNIRFARGQLARRRRIDAARTERMRVVLDGFGHAKR